MCKICIFAGTVEGRKLMSLLAARGVQIAVCVATEYGQALLGDHPDVRIYEFDGFDHGNMPQAGHFAAVRYIREMERKMER